MLEGPERKPAAVVGVTVLALCVPLALLALNVHLVASRYALLVEYSRPGFPDPAGMSAAQRQHSAGRAAEYVVGRADDRALLEAYVGGQRLFEDDEVRHLEDVRRLVFRLTLAGLAGAAAIAVAAALWWRGHARWFPRGLQVGGGVTVGLVAVVAAAVALAWRAFFVGFHQVFFAPGTWQFSGSSGLIRLFPEQFWLDTAVALAVACLLGGLLALFAGRRLARRRPAPEARSIP